MSESNNAHDNSSAPLASAEQLKNLAIDPLVLFQQVEQLRKDGVDDATIREAFAQFMEQYQNTSRRAVNSMKRHRDSQAMPSQDEINKMYEDRYKGILDESNDPMVKVVLEAMENSNKAVAVSKVKTPLRRRIAVFIAIRLLGVTISICKLLGVK